VITIDEQKGFVTVDSEDGSKTYNLDTPEAFAAVSDAWLRAGWWVKHPYTFTWMGRPIIQLPEDLVRIQELICAVQPEVIVETGIAHGGSLVFSASLCKLLGRGRVIGVDVEIRPHNRAAIEAHPLFPYITLIEGDSTAAETIIRVTQAAADAASVLVLLDSNHSKAHVLAELHAYAPLVSRGSYIVAMDGSIMQLVAGGPRTGADWTWNNPRAAAEEFARQNADFVIDEPRFLFNESLISAPVSYWRGGHLKRIQ
jgi:cephalosporin hydroxylase